MQNTLTGTVKGPGENPHEFTFITTDNAQTRIGEFVYYEAGDGEHSFNIVGTITERRLVRNLPDSFLADPTTPPALVSSLIGLADEGAELYEIVVETIGYFSEAFGDFLNPRIPPAPGQPVFLASNEMLTKMLSPKQQGQTGGAHLGSLLTRQRDAVPVVLSVKDIVSTHLAVLASTGAGKSYTAGVLIEELLKPYNRAAVLIVDPHGEYHTLQELHQHPSFAAGAYNPEIRIFTPDKIKVRISTLTEADINYLLPETTEKMKTFLSQAYKALINTRREGMWGFQDLMSEILALRYEDAKGQGGGNVSTIDGLEWRLNRRFNHSRIFSDHEHIPLDDLFKPGQCTVLQLSDIEETEQQVIVGTLLRRTNKARVGTVRGTLAGNDEQLPYPVFVLLEEAHRYAPAGTQVVSTNILKQILSEGRKFGVGIGLITQRPGKLDQDVLSQCMTQFIMRIVNPIDQQTIASSVEGAGRRLLDELPALTKGQVIVSGVAINTPVLCQVRTRVTKHGGETIDAPSEWQSYFSDKKVKERERENAVMVKPTLKGEKYGGIDI
ncbi:MAG: ATP-binding protein [Acidobacteria bacterium]|nr:ATP-binding protein [Acidobacteriota bacterium]MBI3426140.1 ATP-binding protein [Acidobacteriota bacterium]